MDTYCVPRSLWWTSPVNWVHLATRFPVRVRVTDPSSEALRIGASATVVLHGAPAPGR